MWDIIITGSIASPLHPFFTVSAGVILCLYRFYSLIAFAVENASSGAGANNIDTSN
jgi:hypothetical protein